MKLIQISLLVVVALFSCALGQRPSPRFQKANVNSPIRSVDFKNFTYRGYNYPDSNENLVLHDGSDGKSIPADFFAASLDSVVYLDFDGDNQDEAVVTIITEHRGSGGYSRDYFVFKYSNGLVNQIFHQRRSIPKPLRVVDQALVITAPYWKQGDGHCCPSLTETSVYRWRAGAFVRTSRKLVRLQR